MMNTVQLHPSSSTAPGIVPAIPSERGPEGSLPQGASGTASKKRASPNDASDEIHPPPKRQRTVVRTIDGDQQPSSQAAGGKRKRAPKKPVRPPKPAPTDPATWPKSHLGNGDRITATEAKQQYRVTTWELKYLPCEMYGGYLKFNPTQLYWERDIELVAWKKHGGPEGWKWYLDKLRASHQKRSPGKPFICPLPPVETQSNLTASDDDECSTDSQSSCQACPATCRRDV